MKNIFTSNGITKIGHRSVIIRLPEDHFLVIVTNSDDLSADDLLKIGIAAFKQGMGAPQSATIVTE